MPKYSDKPCARCGKMMLHAYCSQRYCKACAPLVRRTMPSSAGPNSAANVP